MVIGGWGVSHEVAPAKRPGATTRLEGVPPPRLEPEYVILLVKFVFKRIYPWWWASRRSDGNTISNKNSIVNDEF